MTHAEYVQGLIEDIERAPRLKSVLRQELQREGAASEGLVTMLYRSSPTARRLLREGQAAYVSAFGEACTRLFGEA